MSICVMNFKGQALILIAIVAVVLIVSAAIFATPAVAGGILLPFQASTPVHCEVTPYDPRCFCVLGTERKISVPWLGVPVALSTLNCILQGICPVTGLF